MPNHLQGSNQPHPCQVLCVHTPTCRSSYKVYNYIAVKYFISFLADSSRHSSGMNIGAAGVTKHQTCLLKIEGRDGLVSVRLLNRDRRKKLHNLQIGVTDGLVENSVCTNSGRGSCLLARGRRNGKPCPTRYRYRYRYSDKKSTQHIMYL